MDLVVLNQCPVIRNVVRYQEARSIGDVRVVTPGLLAQPETLSVFIVLTHNEMEIIICFGEIENFY